MLTRRAVLIVSIVAVLSVGAVAVSRAAPQQTTGYDVPAVAG